MRIAVTVALFAALSSGPALAQPSKPSNSKPAPAAPPLALLAAQGDLDAQVEWGRSRLASNRDKTRAEGVAWLVVAAAGGSSEAAAVLARAYEQGGGVPANAESAARWWYRAGDLGLETARGRFVEMYLGGQTDQLFGPSSVRWLTEAAQGGDTRAALALASLFQGGRGIPADPARARRWLYQAAVAGDVGAKTRLGWLLLRQPGVWQVVDKSKGQVRQFPAKPTPDQAGADEKDIEFVRPGMIEGEAWLTEAAEAGDGMAQFLLGRAYLDGMDLPADPVAGVRWVAAAVINGQDGAEALMGDLAAKGDGFYAADPIRSWVSYDLAASQGVGGAGDLRDQVGKTLTARQLARAKQLSQDFHAY